MSAKAVAWAFEQRVGNATAKLVLLSLAEHHNRSTGECFPSLKTLASDAESDPRTIRRHLRLLEEGGFIECITQFSKRGAQTSNSYRLLGLQMEVTPRSDCPGGGGAICPGAPDTAVPPVITEPESEPLRESARAKDLFDQFRKSWPTSAADSRSKTWAAFESCDPDQQQQGVERVEAYLRHVKTVSKRSYIVAGWTYWRERKWEETPSDATADRDSNGAPTFASVWSQEWTAELVRAAIEGQRQRLGVILSNANQRTGTRITTGADGRWQWVSVSDGDEALRDFQRWFSAQTGRHLPALPPDTTAVRIPINLPPAAECAA